MCAHQDVPSHCHRVRAGSWWAGGVQPEGYCLPRWSPSQSSSWAQSCRAKRSRPPAWWRRSLVTPPSQKLGEDRRMERERGKERQKETGGCVRRIYSFKAQYKSLHLQCSIVNIANPNPANTLNSFYTLIICFNKQNVCFHSMSIFVLVTEIWLYWLTC